MPVPKLFSPAAKLSFACSCLLLTAGCQQQPEPQPAKEQLASVNVQHETADLSLLCQKLEEDMQEISNQRTAFALEQINQDLKVCLPLQDLAQQRRLLQRSNAMYQRFLHVGRSPVQQLAFEQYAFDMAQHPTIQQSHFEQLALRDQYLLKHQGQAYVELIDGGQDGLHYRRSPEYLAKVFAPYMPEAERVFIENLAQQNLQPAFRDQSLLIDAPEIARRALFWEDYIQKYPKSSYIQDARQLLHQYKIFLFKGLKDTPVSSSYAGRLDVQAGAAEEMQRIAKLKDSTLALQAGRFLHFLEMSPEQRLQAAGGQSGLSPWQQLELHLNLRSPAPRYKKDCFSDAVCR
ncbi:MAG: hypothetical protein WB445_12475 [Acinetobacter sp.]